jgi:hypothetical protein
MDKIQHFLIALFLVCILGNQEANAKSKIIVSLSTWLIDGKASPYNSIKPGDTVYFQSGTRSNMRIQNFTGSPREQIVFINYNGVVTINTDGAYGIDVKSCRYIRVTGTGNTHNFYGFMITRVQNGAGLSFGGLTSDFECDHIYVSNVPIAGVYAKTDPDCSLTSTRDKFTQYNTVFHDNYFSNTGNEGMYIGSSFYSGETINCNGQNILVYPSLLSGVRVYNNIIKYSGWDGIQVGSASTDCMIMNNLVMYDSQAGVDYQMSGILIGGGSNCDCYNNYIYKGKGDGIESLGLAGYKIYNNVIADAGYNYYPNDPSKMKYGIYVNDNSCLNGRSFSILFNDIIHPKTDGIRFSSIKSKNNLIASNAIINPGAGSKGYIVVSSPSCEVSLKNNYLAMSAIGAGFADTTYSLLKTSPLIDAGYTDNKGITFDYYYHIRPYGRTFDIGINEYNPKYAPQGMTREEQNENNDTIISPDRRSSLRIEQLPFPDPASSKVSLTYTIDSTYDVFLDVYDFGGVQINHFEEDGMIPGSHIIDLDVGDYPEGVCLFTLRAGRQAISGKFIKTK